MFDRCPACGVELQDELAERETGLVFTCPRPNCGLQLEQQAEQIVIRSFELCNGYSLCVLPFAIENRRNFDAESALDNSPRWRRRTFSLENLDDVERTEYFLPYVRRFLFPTLYEDRNADGESRGEPTCRHYDFDLNLLGAVGEDGLPITLTCHERRKRMTFRYDMLLESAKLVLFNYGVGFIVLKFTMRPPHQTFHDQMDALIHLRMIAPLYAGFDMPVIAIGETRFGVPQLLAYLLAEFNQHGKPPAAPADSPQLQALPVKPTYDDRMMVYTFSCLNPDSCLSDVKHNQRHLSSTSIVNFERRLDASPQETSEPPLRTWQHQRWQGFSKDGGSLVVFNTDRFHERYLGMYTETYYFDIFLLAVLQRVTLLNLFERLSDIQALTKGGSDSRRLLRRVRKDLLLFKNQCWFSQITNRERGLQLWKRWQEQLENRTLLDEVNEQGEELDNYLQGQTRERVEWLVRLGGFLAAAVPAVLGVDILLGKADWVNSLKWILLVSIIVGCGVFAWVMIYRQRDDA